MEGEQKRRGGGHRQRRARRRGEWSVRAHRRVKQQLIARTQGRRKEKGGKTGRFGLRGRIEGGLLSASSDSREAALRQQVLVDREELSQTLADGRDT